MPGSPMSLSVLVVVITHTRLCFSDPFVCFLTSQAYMYVVTSTVRSLAFFCVMSRRLSLSYTHTSHTDLSSQTAPMLNRLPLPLTPMISFVNIVC